MSIVVRRVKNWKKDRMKMLPLLPCWGCGSYDNLGPTGIQLMYCHACTKRTAEYVRKRGKP